MKIIKIKEGSAEILVPEETLKKPYTAVDVFYNPRMRVNRDISVLVLQAHKNIVGRKLKILDAMAATGIRSIRFLKETDAVEEIIINDLNPKAVEFIKRNLEINKIEINEKIRVENKDCLEIMLKEKFDYIEIDPYGTPVPFLDLAVRSLRRGGILSVTATDVAALTGAREKALRRKYQVIGFKTDFFYEFGLRVLAKKIIEIGAQYDFALVPIFGYYKEHHYKIFFVKKGSQKLANELLENIRFISYCEKCMYREIDVNTKCKVCGSSMKILGPIYTGPLWDEKYVNEMLRIDNPYISEETRELLNKIKEEMKFKTPWYYDLRFFAKKYKYKELKKIEYYLQKLEGVRTHFSNLGIKTDKDPYDVIKILSEEAIK